MLAAIRTDPSLVLRLLWPLRPSDPSPGCGRQVDRGRLWYRDIAGAHLHLPWYRPDRIAI